MPLFRLNVLLPIILLKSHITSLIIRDVHLSYVIFIRISIMLLYWLLHYSIMLLHRLLHYSVTLLDGTTCKIICQCVRCFRIKPTVHYLLPAAHITDSRLFINCMNNCDLFLLRKHRNRNWTDVKVYVTVFIYLAMKCIRIVFNVFNAIFKRFVICCEIYCNIYSANRINFSVLLTNCLLSHSTVYERLLSIDLGKT